MVFYGRNVQRFQDHELVHCYKWVRCRLLTSNAYKALNKTIIGKVSKVQIVGFAHTHPIGYTNKPSSPDIMLKQLGWIVNLRIFPIAVYKNII